MIKLQKILTLNILIFIFFISNFSCSAIAFLSGNFVVIEQEARTGNVKAQVQLGDIFAGDQVLKSNDSRAKPDDKEACIWYKKAADQGSVEAQSRLGDMYAKGRGVDESDQVLMMKYERFAKIKTTIGNIKVLLDKARSMLDKNCLSISKCLFTIKEQSETENLLFNSLWEHFNVLKTLFSEFDIEHRSNQLGVLIPLLNNEIQKCELKSIAQDKTKASKKSNALIKQQQEHELQQKWADCIKRIIDETQTTYEKTLAYLEKLYEREGQKSKNEEKAIVWFQEAASQGDSNHQCHLADFFSTRKSLCAENEKKAIKLYRQAAKQKNPQAQFNLAMRYKEGKGVEQDKKKSIIYIKKAAEQGHTQAQFELGRKYQEGIDVPKSSQRAIRCFRQAVANGCNDALFHLALMYENSEGVLKNDTDEFRFYSNVALKMYEEAAYGYYLDSKYSNDNCGHIYIKGDHVCARFRLGQIYKKGDGVPKNDVKAFKIFFNLAKEGDLESEQMFTEMYVAGRGVPKENQEVESLYSKLKNVTPTQMWKRRPGVSYLPPIGNKQPRCLWGSLDRTTQCQLVTESIQNYKNGISWMNGEEGFIKDEAEAMALLTKSANQGYVPAQMRLVKIYTNGNSENIKEALEWLYIVVDQFDWLQEKVKSVCYDNVKPSLKNYESNVIKAQCLLGEIYAKGRFGVEIDEEKSFKYYKKAAELCSAKAQYAVGEKYSKGHGVKQDNKQAICWYSKSARQKYKKALEKLKHLASTGDALAQYTLGEMYIEGKVVEKNMQAALLMIEKAAMQGYVEAQYDLGELFSAGIDVEKNEQKAIQWYLKAAEQNNNKAQLALGKRYQKGVGVLKNTQQAIWWYRKAVRNRSSEAKFLLARMYEKGEGVIKKDEKDYNFYRKEAEALYLEEPKHVGSRFRLGFIYRDGDGLTVSQNDVKAFELFFGLVKDGYIEAEDIFKEMYESGRGVPENNNIVSAWYNKLCNRGKSDSDIKLKTEMTVSWIQQVSDHKCAEEQYKLSEKCDKDFTTGVVLSVCKKDVIKNMKKAITLLSESANQGFIPAQWELANICIKGQQISDDVSLDPNGGLQWLNIIADQFDWFKEKDISCFKYVRCASNRGGQIKFPRSHETSQNAQCRYVRDNQNQAVQTHCLLGNIYEKGLYGIHPDQKKAIMYYSKAAELGFSEAQVALGNSYENGQGLEKDNEQAVYWYCKAEEQGSDLARTKVKEAAEKGDAIAQYSLGKLNLVDIANGKLNELDENYQIAFQWMKKSADQGYAEAIFHLGDMYATGQGVRKDIEKAEECYKKIAVINEICIPEQLTLQISKNEKTPLGIQETFDKTLGAVEQNDTSIKTSVVGEEVLYQKGCMYYLGYGVEQDYKLAFEFFNKAADLDHSLSQYNIGMMYYLGRGVNKNLEQALSYYNQAVKRSPQLKFKWFDSVIGDGHAGAQYKLGYLYEFGLGFEKCNLQEACFWYKQAAAKGNLDAQLRLGQMYAKGEGVKKDDSLSHYWLCQAEKQGSVEASFCLGNYYYDLEKDSFKHSTVGAESSEHYRQALGWYTQAAERDHAGAQYMLWQIYNNGLGVDEDYKAAMVWLEQSAITGNKEAQYVFGLSFLEGSDNTLQGEKQAFTWCLKAAEQDYAKAQYYIGNSLLKGVGTEQNTNSAYEWLLKSAENDYIPAQCAVGSLLASGQMTGKKGDKLTPAYIAVKSRAIVKWNKQAADKEDPRGQCQLADWYLVLAQNKRHRNKPWLEHERQAFMYYQKAANQSDTEAQFKLGRMYAEGLGMDVKNDKEAIKWYKKAAKKGFAQAQFALGNMYAENRMVEHDEENYKQYKKRAEHGDIDAEYKAGKIAAKGHVPSLSWKTLSKSHLMNALVKYSEDDGLMSEEVSQIEEDFLKKLPPLIDKIKKLSQGIKDCESSQTLPDNKSSINKLTKEQIIIKTKLDAMASKRTKLIAQADLLESSYKQQKETIAKKQDILTTKINKVKDELSKIEHCKESEPYDNRALKWYKKAADQGHAQAQYHVGQIYYDQDMYTEAYKWFEKAVAQKNVPAQSAMAEMLYKGHGVKQDLDKAYSYFLMAANEGNVNAQLNLGYMFGDGIGVSEDQELSFYWTKKAAEQGNAEAQYWIGKMFKNGIGVDQSDQKAYLWFRKAMMQNYNEGASDMREIRDRFIENCEDGEGKLTESSMQLHLEPLLAYDMAIYHDTQRDDNSRVIFETCLDCMKDTCSLDDSELKFLNEVHDTRNDTRNDAGAFGYYRKAVDPGNTDEKSRIDAYFRAGLMIESGRGIEQADKNKAFYMFEHAAYEGHVGAKLVLADRYYRGDFLEQSYENAFRLCLEAARLNNFEAQAKLGLMYYAGEGTPRDGKSALFWLNKAVENGYLNGEVARVLGLIYLNNQLDQTGTDECFAKAYKWFVKALEMKTDLDDKAYAQTAYHLGEMYCLGKGVPQDMDEMWEHFSDASDIDASSLVANKAAIIDGFCYFNGWWRQVNKELGKSKIVDVCSKNDENINGFLVDIYFQGKKTPFSCKEAVEMAIRSANKGNARAQFTLGVLYAQGNMSNPYDFLFKKGEPNHQKAYEWYLKAAEQGEVRAQVNLGAMYANGIYVEENNDKAYEWFKKAAENGDGKAQLRLAIIHETGMSMLSRDFIESICCDRATEMNNARECLYWLKKSADGGNTAAKIKLKHKFWKGEIPPRLEKEQWLHDQRVRKGEIDCLSYGIGKKYYTQQYSDVSELVEDLRSVEDPL